MTERNKAQLNLIEVLNVVNKMDKVFDTHVFIDLFKVDYPESYKKYVAGYKNIVAGNAQLGKFLKRNCEALHIKHVATIISRNMYGRKSSCAQWEKQ